MNKLSNATRAAVLASLTEGVSCRATARLCGVDRGTVLSLLEEAGDFCETYSHHVVRDLPTVRIEADEQWGFCGAKARNATKPGQGDLWTFCALDADSKLVINWLVGARSDVNTWAFVADMAMRLKNRVQLSTDGWGAYLSGVRRAFDFTRCDFAQLIKVYGQAGEANGPRRYSPMVCTGAIKERRIGRPDMAKVSTSYVERFNLETRMRCRRFTRLTNAFSKKADNHASAVALTFFAHNFAPTAR